MNTIKSFSHQVFWILGILFLASAVVLAGGVRNQGTIINAAGKTIKASSFANGKNSVGGTVHNAGWIRVIGGSFANYDTVTNTGSGGTFSNFYGTAGSLFSVGLDNGGTLSHPQGTFSNDSSSVAGSDTLTGAFANGAAASYSTLVGTVVYNGSAQAISNAVKNKTYGTLQLGGGATGTATLGGDSTYANTLTLSAATLDESAKVLALNGTVTGGGTLTASTTGSTTIYNGAGSQNVLSSTYYKLVIQNTGQKTALAGGVTIGNSLNVSTSSDSLDFGANAFTLNPGASVTSAGKLMSSGTVTVPALNPTIGGTFVYYGASQTVAGANYSNLLLRGGSKTLPGTDTVAVSGNYTFEGTVTPTYQTGNSFIYNGTAAQTILGGQSYYQLIAQGASDTSAFKTPSSAFTIQNAAGAGVLVLGNTTLDMGTNSITFVGSHTDSVQGTARIRWNGSNQAIPGTGLTEFYGSTVGTVAAGTYGYLWFTGTGAKTISGTVSANGGSATYASIGVRVDNNLNVTGTLNVTGIDLNNNGTLTNNGVITVN